MTDLSQEGLAPCPFCGGEARLSDQKDDFENWETTLACRQCGGGFQAHQSDIVGHDEIARDQIAAWNRRATSPSGGAGAEATHRHKKRGSKYTLLGIGKMQAESWVDLNNDNEHKVDMREVAVYRSVDDGSLWVRPREEFEDGRFEALPFAAPIAERDGEAVAREPDPDCILLAALIIARMGCECSNPISEAYKDMAALQAAGRAEGDGNV